MSSNRRDSDLIAKSKRTSPCQASVLSMGSSPRLSNDEQDAAGDGDTSVPEGRSPREYLPSQNQAMALLSRALIPSKREAFTLRFQQSVTKEDNRILGEPIICNTPTRWIADAFGCDEPFRLREMGDMFPSHGTMSDYLEEFYVMDIILNRHLRPKRKTSKEFSPNGKSDKDDNNDDDDDDDDVNMDDVTDDPYGGDDNDCLFAGKGGDKNNSKLPVDPDKVVTVWCYKPEDLNDAFDYKFRTMILFMPQCGVFYCARERRKGDAGVAKSLIPLDMSWLRMKRTVTPLSSSGVTGVAEVTYTFGKDGYVKRFSDTRWSAKYYRDFNRVSAWRISLHKTIARRQNRIIYRAVQCHDSDGPMLPPDIFNGQDIGCWPQGVLKAEYNRRLARSNSARMNGRHYAMGCHHFRLPEQCWIIDPALDHYVDVWIDVDTVGHCADRQSVVMIRNLMVVDGEADRQSAMYRDEWDHHTHLLGALNHITFHNTVLNRRLGKGGSVRSKGGDVGTMHAIGTGFDFNGAMRPYASNLMVPERLLRNMVLCLARCGEVFFPQVLAVMRDTESDTGLQPISPMEGDPHKKRSAGFTIDMSVNLGNSSHFDVHDASQGYSVWTEEIPGCGANWYFVLPNVHGKRAPRRGAHGEQLEGKPFAGLAIKLGHGVAISWDGRVIRHCTSISQPDGLSGGKVGFDRKKFGNKLYGTFTAAKEKVVKAGRAQCQASNKLGVVDSCEKEVGDHQNGDSSVRGGHDEDGADNAHEQHDPQAHAPEAKEAGPLSQQENIDNYRIPKKRRT